MLATIRSVWPFETPPFLVRAGGMRSDKGKVLQKGRRFPARNLGARFSRCDEITFCFVQPSLYSLFVVAARSFARSPSVLDTMVLLAYAFTLVALFSATTAKMSKCQRRSSDASTRLHRVSKSTGPDTTTSNGAKGTNDTAWIPVDKVRGVNLGSLFVIEPVSFHRSLPSHGEKNQLTRVLAALVDGAGHLEPYGLQRLHERAGLQRSYRSRHPPASLRETLGHFLLAGRLLRDEGTRTEYRADPSTL